jgi:hypothetical protein
LGHPDAAAALTPHHLELRGGGREGDGGEASAGTRRANNEDGQMMGTGEERKKKIRRERMRWVPHDNMAEASF